MEADSSVPNAPSAPPKTPKHDLMMVEEVGHMIAMVGRRLVMWHGGGHVILRSCDICILWSSSRQRHEAVSSSKPSRIRCSLAGRRRSSGMTMVSQSGESCDFFSGILQSSAESLHYHYAMIPNTWPKTPESVLMRLSISPRVTIWRVPVFLTQTGGLRDKGNGSARRKTGWPLEGETTSDITPSSWEGTRDRCSCQSSKLIIFWAHNYAQIRGTQ